MIGAALLAASAAGYGQGAAGVASNTNNAQAGTAASGSLGGATPSPKSFLRFEGTDLRIGNLPAVTFHGFASQGFLATTKYDYLGGDTQDGSFQFSELGLNASVSPLPHTRIAAQAFAFDIGNVGQYDPMLDYGLVDYNFCDQLGVRGGRIRRPEGIYNQVVDLDLARTFVLLPQGVYDARFRDFYASMDGGAFYGNFNLRDAGSLSYEAYAGFINPASNGGVARDLEGVMPPAPYAALHSVHGCLLYGTQLWYNTPLQGLRVGASASESLGLAYDYAVNPPYGPGQLHSEVDSVSGHFSVEYVVKSWTFQSELVLRENNQHDYYRGAVVGRELMKPWAWYVSGAYRFNRWLELGAYYTEDHETASLPSDKYQRDLAMAFRFDPKPWWQLKIEGHSLRGTGLLNDNHANPTRNEDAWFMLALKTTFSF